MKQKCLFFNHFKSVVVIGGNWLLEKVLINSKQYKKIVFRNFVSETKIFKQTFSIEQQTSSTNNRRNLWIITPKKTIFLISFGFFFLSHFHEKQNGFLVN